VPAMARAFVSVTAFPERLTPSRADSPVVRG